MQPPEHHTIDEIDLKAPETGAAVSGLAIAETHRSIQESLRPFLCPLLRDLREYYRVAGHHSPVRTE